MKMKNKIKLLCIVLCTSLLMSGCTLARPQKEGTAMDERGFIGIYMVCYDIRRPVDFYKNEHLTKRNGKSVLVAKEDGTFPGLDGIALYNRVVQGACDELNLITECGMSDEKTALTASDNGTTIELSATLYLEAGKSSDFGESWTVFSVYQAEDGAIYLNGNSDHVVLEHLSNFNRTNTETLTDHGKTVTNTLTATVFVEERSQLTSLTVRQFNANGTPVSDTDISLTEESPNVLWHPDAAWAVVEEVSDDGIQRTAYTRPETNPDPDAEQVVHKFVLFDEREIGQPRELIFQ